MGSLFLFMALWRRRTLEVRPELVGAALSSFNVENMTYSAEFNSFADMTRSADQILTLY